MASCACRCQERGCKTCCYCGRDFAEGAIPSDPQGSTAFLLQQNAELREQRAALTENCERLEREVLKWTQNAAEYFRERDEARAEVERWKGHHRTAGQESDVWERLASMRKVRMDGLQAERDGARHALEDRDAMHAEQLRGIEAQRLRLQAERDAARAEAKQWEADYLAAAETVGKLEARCQALAAQAPVEQR